MTHWPAAVIDSRARGSRTMQFLGIWSPASSETMPLWTRAAAMKQRMPWTRKERITERRLRGWRKRRKREKTKEPKTLGWVRRCLD